MMNSNEMNVMEGIANRVQQLDERISELEDKNLEIIKVKKFKELKILKVKQKVKQEYSDSIKKASIRLWVYQKRGERAAPVLNNSLRISPT